MANTTLASDSPRAWEQLWKELTTTPLGWTSLTLFGGLLLHIDRAPLWVALVALGMIGWRIIASVRAVPLPGKVLRALLAFALVGAVFARFHTLNGLIAGTLLLLLMCALKLLETRARRDQFIVVGGTLFVLLAACLERQSLVRIPLYLVEAWLCCATLAIIAYAPEMSARPARGRRGATSASGGGVGGTGVGGTGVGGAGVGGAGGGAGTGGRAGGRGVLGGSVSGGLGFAGGGGGFGGAGVGGDIGGSRDGTGSAGGRGMANGGGFDTRAAFLLAGRALLYSLPLAVVLFIVFPRLPGAFWALPRTEGAETGLSDTMSPGSISQLTSSYDIAFRVKFDGAAPPPRERYWRGPVLHNFDGYTWSRSPGDLFRNDPLEYVGPAYHYRVSLEPSQQRWWLSLDTVTSSPDRKVLFTFDYELVATNPVTSLTTYDAVSHTATRATQPLSPYGRRIETALPAGRNPRTRQLAQDMRARVGSDAAFVVSVLELLRTGGFVYSLTPPLLSYDSVDDFLFSTRSGFCGHYASAFVTLMRAANIPARVVTGYLGGEWNPIGEYFIVRQSDAHSWAEVWLDGRGWSRVDPTAVVAPERLTRGMWDLLPGARSTEARLVHSSPALANLLQRWDALNAWWDEHVLKFDYRSQLNLLSRLGFRSPDATILGWAFAGMLTGWLGWIAWQFGRWPSQRRPDQLARAYARLCGKLARVGIPRSAHQGPLAYADTISAQRPDLAQSVRALLTRYADLRYGAPPEAPPNVNSRAQEVTRFARDVARLSLARAR